jgi:hypothetical protein
LVADFWIDNDKIFGCAFPNRHRRIFDCRFLNRQRRSFWMPIKKSTATQFWCRFLNGQRRSF